MKTKAITAVMIMLFLASISVSAVLAQTTVVVSPIHMDGWDWYVTSADGIGEFVAGPDTPPMGVGSAHLFTGTQGDWSAEIRNTDYAGTELSDLTALSYWTYVTQWNGQQAPYIILHLDLDGDGAWDDLLFFEPAYQTPTSGNPSLPDQGLPTLNQWQDWDALVGGWWSLNSIAGATPGTGVKSLADYLAVEPDAVIVNTAAGLGGIRLVVGWASSTDVFNGYVDGFTIGVTGTETTYDFEPFLNVNIDIKPGSYPNSINLKSKGVVPVAVLGSDTFDASTVNPSTVLFAGAAPVRWTMEDVNNDGYMDMLFFFNTRDLSLIGGSTEATLIGATVGGQSIQGTDTVNIVPK